MIGDRTKKGTEVSFSENDTPNFVNAIKMLKNADALLERRKRQLRVKQMKAHKGSWIEQTEAKKNRIRSQSQAENAKTIQAFESVRRQEQNKIEQLRRKGEESRK